MGPGAQARNVRERRWATLTLGQTQWRGTHNTYHADRRMGIGFPFSHASLMLDCARRICGLGTKKA